MRLVIEQILKTTRTGFYGSEIIQFGAVEFLSSRVIHLYVTSHLTISSFLSLIVYAVLDFRKVFKTQRNSFISVNGQRCLKYIGGKKFSTLQFRSLFDGPDYSVGVSAGRKFTMRNFFANYIKINTWWAKRYRKYATLRINKNIYFKLRVLPKKEKIVDSDLQVKFFERAWRNLSSFFKAIFSEKQFFFTTY